MGSRSNISVVGNTTYGINCGGGVCVYDCKDGSNLLVFKTICGEGMVSIITGATTVTISGASDYDVTGATNLGIGDGSIYTSVSDRKINLKSLSGGTNVTITSGSSYITISANDTSGIEWSGNTVNGLATYIDADTICAQSGLIFTGTTLTTPNLRIESGASSGCVLTSDASGNATWQTGGGDALGWSNLASGSTVAGCGTIASGSSCCNTIYGVCAGANLTLGYRNVLIGFCAGTNITQGHGNVLQGLCAGATMSTAFDNTGIGLNSLYDNSSGIRNTAIGANTLIDNTSGCHNSAVGTYALVANDTGCNNSGIGYYSLRYNTSGDFNTGNGTSSLFWNGTGNYNTAMGAQSLYNATGSGNVALGYGAGSGETSISNKLYIANCRLCSLISGEFDNKLVCIDNKLITNEFQMISGASSGCVLTSDASGNATWQTGGGGGLSGSLNGLNDNGSIVKLGGALSETTTISGGSSHAMCFHQLTCFDICNLAGNVNINATGGIIDMKGCDGNCVRIGLGLDLVGGTASYIHMCNLQAQTDETNILYIDSAGKIASGATSGGGVDAFAALTSDSSVTWDTSVGLNKTWSIDNSYTLTLSGVTSGMYGTVKITVSSGSPTITLVGAGIVFKGNGMLSGLIVGIYILAWVATSSTTVEWNIALYE